jgi:hypothetical protein
LLQDQHLPLSRMAMRAHIAVWLEHNHKPLDRISGAIVQQQVGTLATHCHSVRRQLCNLTLIDDVYGTGSDHYFCESSGLSGQLFSSNSVRSRGTIPWIFLLGPEVTPCHERRGLAGRDRLGRR